MPQEIAQSSPVRVSSTLVDQARKESKIAGRSIAGQVDYWARIGAAVERLPGFDRSKIDAALAGRPTGRPLTPEEDVVFFEELPDHLETPTPSGQRFWDLMAQGRNVSHDAEGRIVERLADGTVQVVDESGQ